MSGAASISNSSSASAALRADSQLRYGDIILGRKSTPAWVWVALAAAALVVGSLWIVRR